MIQAQMQEHEQTKSLYDPDLPNASAVLSAISCVSVQYVINPSFELARLALSLANKLSAPQYAETQMIPQIARQLQTQWDVILQDQLEVLAMTMPSNDTSH
jgi:hypothetical protein